MQSAATRLVSRPVTRREPLDVTAAPPGFVRIEIAGGFAAEFGPIYVKRDGERVGFGFHVEERHLNPRAHAHGGALATFADMQLAALMRGGRLTPKQAPTISLALDFLAPAKLGDWIEGDIALVKRTGRLAFSETVLTVAGEAIARSRGMFAYSDAAASLDLPAPPQAAVAGEPPPGFAPIDPGPGFGAFFGPMHYHAERKRLGFRVSPAPHQSVRRLPRRRDGDVRGLSDPRAAPRRRLPGAADRRR